MRSRIRPLILLALLLALCFSSAPRGEAYAQARPAGAPADPAGLFDLLGNAHALVVALCATTIFDIWAPYAGPRKAQLCQIASSLQQLRDQVEMLKETRSIRAASIRIRDEALRHREKFEESLRGRGIVIPVRKRTAVSRMSEALTVGRGLSYLDPPQVQSTYAGHDRLGLGAYPQVATARERATVTNTVAALNRHYEELEVVAADLAKLQAAHADATTPEERRDIQINVDLVRARHDLHHTQVLMLSTNLDAILAAQKIDRRAQGQLRDSLAAQSLLRAIDYLDAKIAAPAQ